jgi:hypothetical protein
VAREGRCESQRHDDEHQPDPPGATSGWYVHCSRHFLSLTVAFDHGDSRHVDVVFNMHRFVHRFDSLPFVLAGM